MSAYSGIFAFLGIQPMAVAILLSRGGMDPQKTVLFCYVMGGISLLIFGGIGLGRGAVGGLLPVLYFALCGPRYLNSPLAMAIGVHWIHTCQWMFRKHISLVELAVQALFGLALIGLAWWVHPRPGALWPWLAAEGALMAVHGIKRSVAKEDEHA